MQFIAEDCGEAEQSMWVFRLPLQKQRALFVAPLLPAVQGIVLVKRLRLHLLLVLYLSLLFNEVIIVRLVRLERVL